MSLTVKRVQRLLRRGKPGRVLDGGGNGVKGLYLAVDSKTAAAWCLRYQIGGRAHWMGLGSARDFTLEQARQRAKEWRQKKADGIDPITTKRAERQAKLAAASATKTFKQCAQDFIERHRGEWRSAKHGLEWGSTLQRYVYPLIGTYDVAQIDRPAVLRVLEQRVPAARPGDQPGTFWNMRTVSANRVRNRIELVLNFAAARGYRPQGENPADWGVLKHVLAKPSKVAPKEHHAAVPYAEVPALLAQLRQREGVSVRALQFLILTAARVGEVLGAQWSEIDLAGKVWTIPAARMKANKEHRVPLSDAAVDLLRHAYTETGNPYLFIGVNQQKLSAHAMGRALARIKSGVTVHGFRSSFSDWSHGRRAFSNGAVEQAYRRGDMFEKRRKLMDAWGTFCTSTPVESGGVVPLRAAVEAS
jgi:integrase